MSRIVVLVGVLLVMLLVPLWLNKQRDKARSDAARRTVETQAPAPASPLPMHAASNLAPPGAPRATAPPTAGP